MYVGPSLFGSGVEPRNEGGIQWRPPARRGDIETLVTKEYPTEQGVISLVDGTFHAYPSVRHIELRIALERGWKVYGLCSMGAIRAAEMAHMGMIPWGRVAQMYRSDRDFADDEVALVHANEPPYAGLSEPLVHIRQFASDISSDGLISERASQELIATLKERWYGYRTLTEVRRELCRILAVARLPEEISSRTVAFDKYRLKQQDLRRFVIERPWQGKQASIVEAAAAG